MAHMQLHTLKMMVGMMAEEYTAKLEILAGRTRFNNTALENAYVQGLPHSILLKVYSNIMLLSGLNDWKTVVHNLD